MIIDGLTARQVEICDMLWECETRHELDELLYALGPEARDAKVLMEILDLHRRSAGYLCVSQQRLAPD